MRRTRFEAMKCSVARTLDAVGEWWTMLIVRDAFLGVRRFEDFQRRLGIARNVLSSRLQTLCEHGIRERCQYQDRPPRHEYCLTDKGKDLYPVVVSLMSWGDKWTAGESGPPLLLVHERCGHETSPTLTCSHCGEAIGARDMTAVPGPGA